jgi:hypothetical protein
VLVKLLPLSITPLALLKLTLSRPRRKPGVPWKTRFNLFRYHDEFHTEDLATGMKTSLRIEDETEAKKPLNAKKEAQRQLDFIGVLNRILLTVSSS